MNECMVCKNYVWELLQDKGAIRFICTKGLDVHSQEACKEYDEHENSTEIQELLNEISYSSFKHHGKVYMTERLLSYLNQNTEEEKDDNI